MRPIQWILLVVVFSITGHPLSAPARGTTSLADSLHNAAKRCIVSDELREAIVLLDRAIGLVEERHGPAHERLAGLLDAKARILNSLGFHDDALTLFERTVAIATARPDGDPAGAAAARLGLASIKNKKGDFLDAKNTYERCLSTLEKARGSSDPLVVEAAIGLGTSLGNLGKYADAEKVLRRYLDEVIGVRGERTAQAGDLLLSLAEVLAMLGQHVESTQLYRRAFVVIKDVHGSDHTKMAAALSGLAHTERQMGNSPAAAEHYRRCIDIVERLHGSPHPDLIHYRCRLGMCLFERQQFGESIDIIEQGIAEAREIYGENSYQVAIEQRHLGLVLDYVQRWDEAYAVFRESLSSLENYYGPNHPYVSKCLKGLAMLSLELRRPREAYDYIRRAVSLHEHSAGRDQFELSYLLGWQSAIELHLEMWDAAVNTDFRATETAQAVLEDVYQVASAREASMYAARPWVYASNLVGTSMAGPARSDSIREEVFTLVAKTHGQVLDWLAERQRFLDRSEDSPRVARARKDFTDAAQHVADLSLRGPGDNPDEYHRALITARREQEVAERSLSATTEALRVDMKLTRNTTDPSPKELAQALPPGATLIHFVHYPKWGGANQAHWNPRLPHYGAFCLRNTGDHTWDLEFIELDSALALDSLVFAYRQSIDNIESGRRPSARDEAEFRAVSRKLYDRIWESLIPYTANKDTAGSVSDTMATIFLVPVMWLHVLDFNTLLAPTGELVIEQSKLHILSSARDLLRPPASSASGTGLLAVGNPARSSLPHGGKADKNSDAHKTIAVPCAGTYRIPDSLPGAERETRIVADLFSRVTGDTATVLLGPRGTEAVVKKLLPGKRIVHLATHGFFCDEGTRQAAAVAERLTDPLLMSGLILGTGPGDDDGLLTAQEVIGLDLTDLDWIVLSACGSGLGRLLRGEGVFGLRRAFEIAGARTVVMALWRIDDISTQELMARIYELRLSGHSTIDSVRQAQLERLRDQRRRLNRIHPALWGGIIAEGDWR